MKHPDKTFYAYIDQDANGVFIRFVGPDDPLYDVARNQYIDRMIQLEKNLLNGWRYGA